MQLKYVGLLSSFLLLPLSAAAGSSLQVEETKWIPLESGRAQIECQIRLQGGESFEAIELRIALDSETLHGLAVTPSLTQEGSWVSPPKALDERTQVIAILLPRDKARLSTTIEVARIRCDLKVDSQDIPAITAMALTGDLEQIQVPVEYQPLGSRKDVSTVSRVLDLVPNPALGSVEIQYRQSQTAYVDVTLYDLGGRIVSSLFSGQLEPGHYSWRWDGRDNVGREAAAGFYFVKAHSEAGTTVRRLAFLR